VALWTKLGLNLCSAAGQQHGTTVSSMLLAPLFTMKHLQRATWCAVDAASA
jgi:hypothetical protein